MCCYVICERFRDTPVCFGLWLNWNWNFGSGWENGNGDMYMIYEDGNGVERLGFYGLGNTESMSHCFTQ